MTKKPKSSPDNIQAVVRDGIAEALKAYGWELKKEGLNGLYFAPADSNSPCLCVELTLLTGVPSVAVELHPPY